MFTLVRSNDNSLGIYSSKNITKNSENKYTVKHRGCKYEAQIIASDAEPCNDTATDSDLVNFIRRKNRTRDTITPRKKKRSTSPYGTVKRTRWTQEEKDLIFREFSEEMKNETLPSLAEIQNVIRENPLIQTRTSPQIKTWIHNQYTK